MKALLKVGYACNELCTFCHTEDVRHIDDTSERVSAKIDRAAQLGHSMLVLSGGEPTIRPELFAWARRSAVLGMDFGLVTNGQLLGYEDVRRRLVRSGLRYVYMSLHGGTARVNSSCTRSEGFEAKVAAVQALAADPRVELIINCVVTSANMAHLRGLVDLLAPHAGGLVLQYSGTEPKGGARRLMEIVVPPVAEVAAAVVDAMGYADERGLPAVHGGLPMCLLPGLEDRYGDLRTHGFVSMSEVWEDDWHPVDERNRCHPPPCQECALRGPCPGLYSQYAEQRGHDELRPVRGPRSNSFNYAPQRQLTWPAGEPCPVQSQGATPFHHPRTVFLRRGDSMIELRSRTRDFADDEIDAVVRGLGQLYVDVSDKRAPDDFSADLRKLAPTAECETCPERESCGRCWEPVSDDWFARDDGVLRQVIAGLQGDVLDIGCGDGRYGDVLAPLVTAGQLRYRGVDPDSDAVATLKGRWPWAELQEAAAEQLDLEEQSVDHVLVLHSYNHLADPASVLPRLVRAVRPGGTLLMADNVAFGLVRTAEQIEAAEAGPAVHEHLRNHSGEEAAQVLSDLDLTLLQARDVGPDTSNQWFRHYRVGAA